MALDRFGNYRPGGTHPPIPASQSAGEGSPEGVVPGSVGDTFWDYSNGALYIKDSGNGTTTGWIEFSGGGGGGGTGLSGNGSPEGSETATPGTTYWDTTNNVFYVKDTGSGNTGWREIIG